MTLTEPAADCDLDQRMTLVAAHAGQPVTSAAALEQMLATTYDGIMGADIAGVPSGKLRAAAPRLRRDLFLLRLGLRGRISEWRAAGLMSQTAQQRLRDCLRAARFASDMLGEISLAPHRTSSTPVPLKAFTRPDYSFIAPSFDTDEGATFQSGDVMLMRGIHHNSAAIARIGDVDSQFSHACIVHVDRDGTQIMVESLIEDGAVIKPLGKALAHGNARALLFRHPDRDLAARASQIAYDHVRRSYGTWKKRIPYDFTMRLDRSRPLFCSKLVRLAYERASKGEVRLPTFPTRFAMKNRDFLDRIGVLALETFAPGDMEIEPRFDLVAEWQDLRVTPRIRTQDLIMVKLFEWMDHYGYVFREDALIRIVARFGRLSAYFSEDVKELLADVVPKVPRNMSRRTIAAVAMLHKTAEPLLEEIAHADEAHLARTGVPLHPRQVYALLELVRERSDGRIGYLVLPGA